MARSPWWHFVAIGALGPSLILFANASGPWRGVAVVAFAVIIGGLLIDDRGRRSLRPRRSVRSGHQQWRFTGMILSVIVITQLVQRAGNQANAWLMAGLSFVALVATSWWFTRRVEAAQ